MRRGAATLVSLLLLAHFAPAGAPALEPGFEWLFPNPGPPVGWRVTPWNDLAGTLEHEGHWDVREGILHGSPDRGTWLISEKEFGDLELRYEFKLGPRGNSGLALRAPLRGDPAFDGLELQMADLRYNPSAKPSELTGALYRAATPIFQAYQPEAWNEMNVLLEKDHLTVFLNGILIQDLDLSSQHGSVPRHDGSMAPPLSNRPKRGHIGFQELSRGSERVQIRRARVRVIETPSGMP